MAKTHFGFQSVDEEEKASRVRGVFSSVAPKYDIMNDLMSAGLHRLWKKFTIEIAAPKRGERVLDVAGGTADLASAFARRVGVGLKDGTDSAVRRGKTAFPEQLLRYRHRRLWPAQHDA